MEDGLSQSNKIAGENQRQQEERELELARDSQRELEKRYGATGFSIECVIFQHPVIGSESLVHFGTETLLFKSIHCYDPLLTDDGDVKSLKYI